MAKTIYECEVDRVAYNASVLSSHLTIQRVAPLELAYMAKDMTRPLVTRVAATHLLTKQPIQEVARILLEARRDRTR